MASPTIDDRKTAGASTLRATLGQIMSALDDRDLLPALRLLEPRDGDASLDHDRQNGPRCKRCATRGE